MNKKTNEPIKHHWIPQFILRNFADKNGYVNFHNNKTGKEEYLLPKEIFVYDNLYRDDKNNPNLPVEIEHDLAALEGEVSIIFHKLLEGDQIELSKDEYELLKLFTFIMNFRSKRSRDFFSKNLEELDKELYKEYQQDGEMNSFWKRNLAQLAKCRSLNDVVENEHLSRYVKFYAYQDTQGFEGSILMVYRIKGKEKLILSDAYPITDHFENGFLMKYTNFYFPISPDKVLILFKNFMGEYPITPLMPGKRFIRTPKEENGKLIISVGKEFEKFAKALNKLSIEHLYEGFIYKN